MRLWVTRPELDAAVLRARLIGQGHEVVVEPLLIIDFTDADPIELDDVQAIIATSRNGVRAAAESPVADEVRQLPLFAVGPGTAATAEALGFENVVKGPSTADRLLQTIVAGTDVNGGALLHLAGGNLAFDLAGELRQLGYHVLQPTVYVARTAPRLSHQLLSRIVHGNIDGVIILSPRTAQTYVDLVMAHQVEHSARKLVHFCLSTAVAARLAQLQPEDVRVPNEPNIGEMLELTDQTTAQS
jgi:uroporphyrinogen-III synthase